MKSARVFGKGEKQIILSDEDEVDTSEPDWML